MLDQDRPAPPKPVKRKDSPITVEYEERAKTALREAMREQGVTINELTERLRAIGVDMAAGAVANKISRGGFSAAFYLQCMDALAQTRSV